MSQVVLTISLFIMVLFPTGALADKYTDFNGDGVTDLLFQHTNGSMKAWYLNNNGTLNQSKSFDPAPSGYQVEAVGNVTGDAAERGDVVWRNGSGAVRIWRNPDLNNGQDFINIPPIPLSDSIVGVIDINQDGAEDIIIHRSNGDMAIQYMDNAGGLGPPQVVIGAQAPAPWQARALGDMNGDSFADIVFFNTTTLVTVVWLLDSNGDFTGSSALQPVINPWTIVDAGRFNNDGRADILWHRYAGTTSTREWLMSTTATIQSFVDLLGTGSDWFIQATGPVNSSGQSSIFWRQNTGQVSVWFLNTNGQFDSAVSPGTESVSWTLRP